MEEKNHLFYVGKERKVMEMITASKTIFFSLRRKEPMWEEVTFFQPPTNDESYIPYDGNHEVHRFDKEPSMVICPRRIEKGKEGGAASWYVVLDY